MNKRYIYIIVIVLLLCAICVVEQRFISSYFQNIKQQTQQLVEYVKNKTDINTPTVKQKVEQLNNQWQNYETTLCFFVNLKDIEDVGVELAKMRVYANENSVADFNTSLELILYHIDSYYNAMGVNFENIF